MYKSCNHTSSIFPEFFKLLHIKQQRKPRIESIRQDVVLVAYCHCIIWRQYRKVDRTHPYKLFVHTIHQSNSCFNTLEQAYCCKGFKGDVKDENRLYETKRNQGLVLGYGRMGCAVCLIIILRIKLLFRNFQIYIGDSCYRFVALYITVKYD